MKLKFDFIIMYLQIKEVNITTKFVLLVFNECDRVDCSIPLHTSRVSLMVPWPEEESRILAPIRPFQTKVYYFSDRKLYLLV